jgi:hypothetical protein
VVDVVAMVWSTPPGVVEVVLVERVFVARGFVVGPVIVCLFIMSMYFKANRNDEFTHSICVVARPRGFNVMTSTTVAPLLFQ